MPKVSDDRASRPDDENPEWTEETFKKARPAKEVLGNLIGQAAARSLLERKPQHYKISQTLELDADVMAAYRNEGSGWQARVNDVLRKHMPVGQK